MVLFVISNDIFHYGLFYHRVYEEPSDNVQHNCNSFRHGEYMNMIQMVPSIGNTYAIPKK